MTANRAAGLVSRVMVRTSRTPLRAVWSLAYRGLIRLLSASLRWGHPERSVYLAGGFGNGEVLYGASDLDLIAVTPTRSGARGREREAAATRMRRTIRRLRLPNEVVHFAAIEDEALVAAGEDTTHTYGLDRDPPGAIYHGPDALWRSGPGLLHGPALNGTGGDWRRLAGPERRLPLRPIERDRRPLIAWLRIQSLWRFVFYACLWPGPRAPYLCVKLIAEALRALDWLEGGAPIQGRVDPLLRFRDQDSQRGEAALHALDLYASLPRSPEAPLERTLTDFAFLCDELARAIDAIALGRGSDEVALRHGELIVADAGRGLLPLADWRSLCYWFPPDEALAPMEGDPARPADIRRAAAADDGQRCPVLRRGELLVQPTGEIHERGILRSVQCPASDPVSFAVLGGREVARFPRLPGWSVEDWAGRATAEYRQWLDDDARHARDDPGFSLGKLFAAARAALLQESVRGGAPELPLTVAAIAEALGEAHPGAGQEIEESVARYRAWRRDGESVTASDLTRLWSVVTSLPNYDADTEQPELAQLEQER